MYRSALGEFESPEAEAAFIEELRRMTPNQKSWMALEMWQQEVDAMRAQVAHEHPDWTTAQVRANVARQIMELNGAAEVLRSRGVNIDDLQRRVTG